MNWNKGPCKVCKKPSLMDGPYCITHYELSLGKPDPLWWKHDRPVQATFRRTDPSTSAQAAISMPKAWNTHRARLLAAYAHPDALGGLTDEEACTNVGLERGGWKRCSELRKLGLIRATMMTRAGSSGLQQQVCEITKAGIAALKEMRAA